MSISNSISRLVEYYKRHGFAATVQRAGLGARRALFAGRMVVFYCDLDPQKLKSVNLPTPFSVERIGSLAELSAEHFQQITSFWNPTLAQQNIRERFEKGASLWLVRAEDQLVGFGWTLGGKSIDLYYFPLGQKDVQLFDFYVFPRFRGRALHWLLTSHILNTLATEGWSRAFADTGEWNQAQLASFKMTAFRPLGSVRKFCVFGRVVTCWRPTHRAAERQDRTVQMVEHVRMLGSNEQ